MQDIGAAQHANRIEVAALGDAPPVHGDQRRAERAWVGAVPAAGVHGSAASEGGELRLKIPVLGGAEGDPLPFAVNDETGGHRLDSAGRQPRHDLLPQHWRDLIAVQPVEHPPGLVRVNQGLVELARVGDGLRDRLGGDLVEDHPAVGNLRLQFLDQVPGDGLALAVLIRGEQQFVGVLEQVLQLGHLLALIVRDNVEGLEAGVHVDPETGPGLLAVLGRDLRCLVGHVPDVANAGLDHVPVAQVARDRARLGRRLDNDQPGAVTAPRAAPRSGHPRTGRGLGRASRPGPTAPAAAVTPPAASFVATVSLAAPLLAGTLFPTSHLRHGLPVERPHGARFPA